MTWSLSRGENWIMVCEGDLNEIKVKELIQHVWDVQSQGLRTNTHRRRFSHTHTCCTCAHDAWATLHTLQHQHKKRCKYASCTHACKCTFAHMHTWPIGRTAVVLIPFRFAALWYTEMMIFSFFEVTVHPVMPVTLCLPTNLFTAAACSGSPNTSIWANPQDVCD